MAETLELPNIEPDPKHPAYGLSAEKGRDLRVKLDKIFQFQRLEALTDRQLRNALYVLEMHLGPGGMPGEQALIRAFTINHVLTSRFLRDLDKKNTRLTWLVIILATLAVIVGGVQTWATLYSMTLPR
jgi:hypothetical protein